MIVLRPSALVLPTAVLAGVMAVPSTLMMLPTEVTASLVSAVLGLSALLTIAHSTSMPASVRGLKPSVASQSSNGLVPVLDRQVERVVVPLVGVDAVFDVDVGRIERVGRVDGVVPVTDAGRTRSRAEHDDAHAPLVLDTGVVLSGGALDVVDLVESQPVPSRVDHRQTVHAGRSLSARPVRATAARRSPHRCCR